MQGVVSMEDLPGLGGFSSDESETGPKVAEAEQEVQQGKREKRERCLNGCDRPCSVCICPYLPPTPIPTSTQIIILHHPHELHHNKKLSTLPPLTKSLLNLHSLRGRRLRYNSHPLLDSLHDFDSNSTALFLFPSIPSSPSYNLLQWVSENPRHEDDNLVLIVFDGTWNHAKEMVNASLPFLSGFARHVSLGNCDVAVDGLSTLESDLLMRKEPYLGCMSTMEAVARALRILEPRPAGLEIEERLLGVLRAMVAFQACHLQSKSTKRRPRLMKKKEMKKKIVQQQEYEHQRENEYKCDELSTACF